MMYYKENNNQNFIKLVSLICFITNISQMPYFINFSVSKFMSTSVWILLAVICLLKSARWSFNNVKPAILFAGMFLVLYGCLSLFDSAYTQSELPRSIFLAVFVLIVGLMVGDKVDLEEWNSIFTAYILSGMLVTVNVFFSYIRGNSLGGRFYLYSGKNSVSQILLTVWLLILMTKITSVRAKNKWFYIPCFVFVTYVLLMLQSRATLIGIPIVALWYVYNGKFNRRLRFIVIVGMIGFILALFLNETLYDFIFRKVLTGGRDINNLYDLSSERLDEWVGFWDNMKNSPLLGHGRDKQESLILTSLLEFGFLGGGIILLLAIYPLKWSLKNKYQLGDHFLILSSLSLIYCVNGIFEQLAPFGPGVKCYLIWFILGGYATGIKRQYEYWE